MPFNRVVKVYVTRPGGTRTLLEQHTYDVYPAGVTGASPKGMKTASRIAQIGSDGNVSGYADISWSYDERKRPVQTVVRYGDAGVLSENTEYGFSGEVTSRTFAYTGKEDQTPDFGVNALRSAGDIYFPVLVGIIVMWGVQVVGSYVLGIGLGWGLIAMWAVFALDENIRGLIFLHRWNSFRWVGKGFVK